MWWMVLNIESSGYTDEVYRIKNTVMICRFDEKERRISSK